MRKLLHKRRQIRTWFVTGCSTGIGRGIAKAVLKAGDQAEAARILERLSDQERAFLMKMLRRAA